MIFYSFPPIEDISASDIQALKGLAEQLVGHAVEFNREYVKSIFARASVLVARDADGKIVGMASLYKMPLFSRVVGHVEQVVVDKDARGQGIGRGLMEQLIVEARKLGISRLILTSRPDRAEANQLYQKLGFEKYETNVYRMDLK